MRIEFPTPPAASTSGAMKESPDQLLHKMLAYKKWFLYLFVGTTVLSLIVTYLCSREGKNSKAFFHVEEALVDFSSKGAVDSKTVENLEGTLKTYPELAGRFGNILAQHFLTMNQMKEADKHAEEAFQRTLFVHSYYTDFARNSLLIEQKEYTKALEASKALKEKMLADSTCITHDFGGLLFGFNLIRMVFLYQLLDQKELELQEIRETKKFLGWGGEKGLLADKISQSLLRHFSDESVSMIDYFNDREIALLN